MSSFYSVVILPSILVLPGKADFVSCWVEWLPTWACIFYPAGILLYKLQYAMDPTQTIPKDKPDNGSRKETGSFDYSNGKLPQADEAVFPRSPWEPVAQPRAELTSPESFKDHPSSPHQFIF